MGHRVTYIKGNALSQDDMRRACDGVDVVFATFAMIRFWESHDFQADLSIKVNIDATKNVIDCCQHCGVKRIIQTSSSNVIVTPGWNKIDMDEESPYIPREVSHNHYSWTKAVSE